MNQKMEEISFDERKKIQLKMLIEVDEFCRANNIRYSLAYGTLIGAIRHQGFIPWDDDVDIMMPYPDLMRFKELFVSNIQKLVDVDNDRNYKYAFPRLSDLGSYMMVDGKPVGHGVSIDLYPVLGLPSCQDDVVKFLKKAKKRLNMKKAISKLKSILTRRLGINLTSLFSNSMKNYRDYLYQFPYEKSKNYLTYGGGLHLRNVVDYDLFDCMTTVNFEGYKMQATAHYDKWLRHFYGDYMQLPPEDKRHPYHGEKFYKKKE